MSKVGLNLHLQALNINASPRSLDDLAMRSPIVRIWIDCWRNGHILYEDALVNICTDFDKASRILNDTFSMGIDLHSLIPDPQSLDSDPLVRQEKMVQAVIYAASIYQTLYSAAIKATQNSRFSIFVSVPSTPEVPAGAIAPFRIKQ